MMQERRQKVRFPLVELARYRRPGRQRKTLAGVGQTVNFSSSGALLRVQEPFRVGDPLEMSVEWPVLLNGSVPIRLLAHGHVVRVDEGTIALKFEGHEFRTSKGEGLPRYRVS